MKKRVLALAIAGLVATAGWSAKPGSPKLTLDEAVAMALRSNLDLQIAITATRRATIAPDNDPEVSRLSLKQSIIDVIYGVEESYWALVFAYQNLDATRMSMRRAKEMLQRTKIMVRVGSKAPLEIHAPEAEVAAREGDLAAAESQVRTASENLRFILNAPDEGNLVLAGRPSLDWRQADFDALLLLALESRPDIQLARIDLRSKGVEVRYSRNQELPDSQLTATYYASGSGDDRVLGETELLQSNMDDALDDVVRNLHSSSSGVQQFFSSLFRTAGRADQAKAKLDLQQSMLQLKRAEATAYSEVKQVIADLEVTFRMVEASRAAIRPTELKLRAEENMWVAGKSGTYQVLQYQRDVANAQVSQLKSVMDYMLTQSRIDRVTGRTLEVHGIQLDDFVARGEDESS